MISSEQEALLIARLKERDERAFATIVREYQQSIYRVILRMLGSPSDAEEIAQEVFVTVFKSIDSFRGDCKFSTWLYRIAINHSKNRIKYLGRRNYHRASQYDEIADREKGTETGGVFLQAQIHRPDQIAEGRQLEGLLSIAIASLDEDHRSLIILRDVENLTYEEIMQITGLPEGTVKSRLHRARTGLREALEKLQK